MKLYLYRKKESWKRKLHRFSSGSCTVLLYHRVFDAKFDPQGLSVSPKNFEDQLLHLKKSHVFLSVDQFYKILNSGSAFPKKSLLITFDDGYADNYHNALPILQKLKLQALFFIATKNLNNHELFWWDELDLCFKKIHQNKIDVMELKKKHQLTDIEQLYEFYLINCKTASSLSIRESYMDEIRNVVSLDEELKGNYKFMNNDELVKLSQSDYAVIGGHTINHLSLGHLTHIDQKNEIEGSLKYLELLLNRKIEYFAFPYGEKHNYNETTIELCKQLNLKLAAANYCDYVTRKSDLYSFPRFVVRNDDPMVLSKKLIDLMR